MIQCSSSFQPYTVRGPVFQQLYYTILAISYQVLLHAQCTGILAASVSACVVFKYHIVVVLLLVLGSGWWLVVEEDKKMNYHLHPPVLLVSGSPTNSLSLPHTS